MKSILFAGFLTGLAPVATEATAATVYLNEDLISVAVGPGTSPGTFQNTFNNGQTINKVIDAPSADAEEFHNQTTHIWFTAHTIGGGLELLFDFNKEYDISTLHFWNYTSEDFDVDDIAFSFYNNLSSLVGSLSVQPGLGSSPGIMAQDIGLPAPLNVRYVTAFLSGTNGQVDFQNIGFTAIESEVQNPAPIPLPAGFPLILSGLALLGWVGRSRQT